MRGDSARPVGTVDASGGGGFVGGVSAVNAHVLSFNDDNFRASEESFDRKRKKFEKTVTNFGALKERMEEYQCAVTCMVDAGVRLADAMQVFFRDQNSAMSSISGSTQSAQAGIPTAFRQAQVAIRTKWTENVLPRYQENVVRPITKRHEEFPAVKAYIENRQVARQELQKREKKLTRDVNASIRVRDKQRKLREANDRYKLFDDEVLQRFSFIDRTQSNFVLPSLRELVSLLEEFTRETTSSMRDVGLLVGAEPSPITRDLSPLPSRRDGASSSQMWGPGRSSDEGWDDAFDFDDAKSIQSGGMSVGEVGAGPGGGSERTLSVSNSYQNATRFSADDSVGAAEMPARGGGPSRSNVPRPRTHSPMRTQRGVSGTTGRDSVSTSSIPAGLVTGGVSGDAANSDYSLTEGRQSAPGSSGALLHSLLELPANMHGTSGGGSGSVGGASTPGRETGDADSRSERPSVLMRMKVLYEFVPKETNELELRAGDVVEVYEKDQSGWWLGRANHVNGYFPRDYARELTEQEEVDYLTERSNRRRERRRGHRRKDSHDSRKSALSSSLPSPSDTHNPH